MSISLKFSGLRSGVLFSAETTQVQNKDMEYVAVSSQKEHGGGSFPPLDSTHFPSQIFWLVISFSLLYLVLSRFLLPKLSHILEQRKQRIDSDLNEAEIFRESTRNLTQLYEKTLADAHQKAHEVLAVARESFAQVIESEKSKQEAFWSQKIEEERRSFEQMKAAAIEEAARSLEGELSHIIAAKVLSFSGEKERVL